jgi:hypothetical protein
MTHTFTFDDAIKAGVRPDEDSVSKTKNFIQWVLNIDIEHDRVTFIVADAFDRERERFKQVIAKRKVTDKTLSDIYRCYPKRNTTALKDQIMMIEQIAINNEKARHEPDDNE